MSTVLTFDDEIEFAAAHFRHLFPDADVSKGSPNWLWLASQSAGVTSNNANTENTKQELLPDTTIELIDRWGNIKGVPRKGATPARKSKALRVAGTNGTVVPNNRAMVDDATGLQFQTASTAAVAVPPGYVDVDVVGVDVGSQTRLSAGTNLRFVVPVAGLEELAQLQLDMDEDGDDIEPLGDYRSRQLALWRTSPAGGRDIDYVKWATDQVGIASGYCYPLRAGIGTVDVAALHKGAGTDRLLSGAEVIALQAIIDTLRPVSVKAARVLTVTASAFVNIDYTVIPNGDLAHKFDWDDTAGPTLIAWDPVTRIVQLSIARPASMQAGHRVSFGASFTGKERVIEALHADADKFILELDATGDNPVIGPVYSGGPLVQPIRAAIQAVADSLGPANPDAKRYGPWEGNLRPGAINRVASAIDGVLDGTVVAPGATVVANDPVYPDDNSVELLIIGRIIARAQH